MRGKAIRFEEWARWDRLREIKRGPSPGVRPRKRSQRWTARSTDPLTSCLRSLFLHSFLLPSPLLPPPPPRCPTRDSVVLDAREDCPLRPRPRPQSSSPPPQAHTPATLFISSASRHARREVARSLRLRGPHASSERPSRRRLWLACRMAAVRSPCIP